MRNRRAYTERPVREAQYALETREGADLRNTMCVTPNQQNRLGCNVRHLRFPAQVPREILKLMQGSRFNDLGPATKVERWFIHNLKMDANTGGAYYVVGSRVH
jgi:hypothetical protein